MDLEDILAMVVAILGVLIILVPVLGLTLRMVAEPLAEAFAQVQGAQRGGPAAQAMEQRLAAVEENVREVDREVTRLGEEVQFHRQLQDPQAPPRLRAHGEPPP
ncbi:MAG: hypothetical protein H0W11_11250 [Gemmatimonadetes bacterium]|nr:hypothetical protein [Gemmatimonadota bacterium]